MLGPMNLAIVDPSLREALHMLSAQQSSTDPVEELRLRRWARENYVAIAHRDSTWHAIVLDEMQRRDRELTFAGGYAEIARRIVPLVPDHGPGLRGPHIDPARANVLARVPIVEPVGRSG
jgi:hypothetical protein